LSGMERKPSVPHEEQRLSMRLNGKADQTSGFPPASQGMRSRYRGSFPSRQGESPDALQSDCVVKKRSARFPFGPGKRTRWVYLGCLHSVTETVFLMSRDSFTASGAAVVRLGRTAASTSRGACSCGKLETRAQKSPSRKGCGTGFWFELLGGDWRWCWGRCWGGRAA
jgi:hypothetical protein